LAKESQEYSFKETAGYNTGIGNLSTTRFSTVFHDITGISFAESPSSNNKADAQTNTSSANKTIRFDSMGQSFTMKLNPNAVLSRSLLSTNLTLTTPLNFPEILSGKIIGDEQSWARVTMAEGEMIGLMQTNGVLYQIDTSANLGLTNRSKTVLFEPQSMNRRSSSSALTSGSDLLVYADELGSMGSDNHHSSELLSSDNGVRRTIRVGIVVDSRFNEHHNNQGLTRAVSIINAVDGIYQEQLGVALQLDQIVFYDNALTDPMRNAGGSIEDILTFFRTVRINEVALNSDLTLVHLFTGLRDPNNVIGLGWIDTACRRDGYDVSVSTPFAFDALLAAHEIAHNLGALHDDNPACFADSNDIMWPRLSTSTNSRFSYCSRGAMSSGVSSSCNLDNLDLSIKLESHSTQRKLQHDLLIKVTNNDMTRRAMATVSATDLPSGTNATFDDSSCEFSDGKIVCQHGDIPAQQTHEVRVSIVYPDDSEQTVASTIIPSAFTDIEIHNNQMSIQIPPGESATDELPDAELPPQSDDALLASGGGGAGTMLIPLAATFFAGRKRRRPGSG